MHSSMARWIHTTACSTTAAIVLFAPIAGARQVVINFDSMLGGVGLGGPGAMVPPQFLVNTQFLAQGVVFDSNGGGVVVAISTNPVSAPNVALATAPGPSRATWIR